MDAMTTTKSLKADKTSGWRGFLRRLLGEKRGAVAVQFAILVLPLAVLSLGLIDVNRASMSKRTLQDALDAAALIAARSTATTDTAVNAIGQAALTAQLAGSTDGTLISSNFKLGGTGNSTVIATASVSVDPVVADLWLHGNMTVGANSEVIRSSYNLEVSLVLDVTLSMAGTPLSDLKTAAGQLVDLVVKDTQTPYYSKVAIVPYSLGVNLGTANAAIARGAVPAAKTISGASWSTGSAKTITGATKARPVVITSNGHGFANGDTVYISGIKGMTQLNGKAYVVANKQNNTFELSGVDGRNYSSFQSGSTPRATKCQVANCEVVVTANSHGFNNGDGVYVTGVKGMTDLNNTPWTVANKANNTFSITPSFGPDYSAYTSSGSAWCTAAGCEYYRFTNASNSEKVYEISNCVTERVGSNAYNDTAPASSPVGRNYPGPSWDCLNSQVVGLSSNKTSLKSTISGLVAEGTTAGQIGLAWGWYAVSPNFSSIFSGTSLPANYGTPHLMKVVILMTDGEFNTTYCNGVMAKNAASGVVNTSEKINCNATNGDGFAQAKAMCAAMRLKGIIIYTVGFNISDSDDVTDMLNTCATSGTAYLPSNGTALSAAFKAIGQDISSLRISK
jgi:Flp pilus assembly protein TadG